MSIDKNSIEEEPSRHYYGPYKMTLFDPWDNFGTEALTDLDALFEDLLRWRALIADGRGETAAQEMAEILIGFENSKSPIQEMCEANERYFARIKSSQGQKP